MQLAILLVLILIAVTLSPWLLGVMAFLVAAYGLWLVVIAIASVVAVGIVLTVYGLRRGLFPKRDVSSMIEQQIADANAQHRAKEVARLAAENREKAQRQELAESVVHAKTTICKKCQSSIQKHSMYCPVCGKSPV